MISADRAAAEEPAAASDWGELRPRILGRWQEVESGVVLLQRRFGDGRFGRVMDRWFRLSPFRLRLDEIGSFVWLRLDGHRTVEQIAREMRASFGIRAEPAAERLTTFLQHLERGRWIACQPGENPERKAS